jgi:hypothetical protein
VRFVAQLNHNQMVECIVTAMHDNSQYSECFYIKRQPILGSPYCKNAMEVTVVDQCLRTRKQQYLWIALKSPSWVNTLFHSRLSAIFLLGESAYFLFLVSIAMLLPGFDHRLFRARLPYLFTLAYAA